VKEFTTAVREVEEDTSLMEFKVDGVDLKCFKPKDGQLAMLMASTGRHTSQHTKVAGIIDFFVEVMDEPSHHYIVDRLLDRQDPFGLEEVEQIMMWMIEEWTGRPTESPSVSTRSPQSAGQNSTPTTSPSTSSDSLPIGS
jgi:hypothetical protein